MWWRIWERRRKPIGEGELGEGEVRAGRCGAGIDFASYIKRGGGNGLGKGCEWKVWCGYGGGCN